MSRTDKSDDWFVDLMVSPVGGFIAIVLGFLAIMYGFDLRERTLEVKGFSDWMLAIFAGVVFIVLGIIGIVAHMKQASTEAKEEAQAQEATERNLSELWADATDSLNEIYFLPASTPSLTTSQKDSFGDLLDKVSASVENRDYRSATSCLKELEGELSSIRANTVAGTRTEQTEMSDLDRLAGLSGSLVEIFRAKL